MFNILLCIPTVTDMIVQILLCHVYFLCVLSHYDIIFWAVHKPHQALRGSWGKPEHHTELQRGDGGSFKTSQHHTITVQGKL